MAGQDQQQWQALVEASRGLEDEKVLSWTAQELDEKIGAAAFGGLGCAGAGSTQLWYGGAMNSTDEQLHSNGPLRGVAADASQTDATAAAVKIYGRDAVARKVAKSIAGAGAFGISKGTGENLSSDWLAFKCPHCANCSATANSPAGVFTCRKQDGGCGKQARASASGFHRIGCFAKQAEAQAAAKAFKSAH